MADLILRRIELIPLPYKVSVLCFESCVPYSSSLLVVCVSFLFLFLSVFYSCEHTEADGVTFYCVISSDLWHHWCTFCVCLVSWFLSQTHILYKNTSSVRHINILLPYNVLTKWAIRLTAALKDVLWMFNAEKGK